MTRLLLAFIRGYQRLLSPLLPASCRFQPTCSAYMVEAIQVHGSFRGTSLGLRRLVRCRPGGGRGYDPVPERRFT